MHIDATLAHRSNWRGSLIKLAGLNWQAPNYSTLSRRQQTLTVQIPARRSTAGLHLLIDSTGIQFLGEGEWKRKKHGAEYRRQWRKVHLGIPQGAGQPVTVL